VRVPAIPLLLLVASTAAAAPAADLVIVWAPGVNVAPIAAVARTAGAAVVDRSPTAAAVDDPGPLIRRGIEAYDGLRLDEARTALDAARGAIDRTGVATSTQLSDLFLYRSLVATQTGDTVAAWDELVAAVVVAPTRVLDPARFPPRVVADLARAQAAVTERARATLSVVAPDGCTTTIDGAAPSGSVIPGAHWVRVTCADRAPWGSRVDVAGPVTTVTARPIAYAPPDDGDVMIQARTASARAVVVVEIRAEVATVRLIGMDGRERDRRTVAATPDLVVVAEAVRQLLQPGEAPHWYQSRWAWAAGAAVIAAAILIPVTTAIVHDSRASTGRIEIPPQ
jgi:hypothetical protein